jgi:hypothetical protein
MRGVLRKVAARARRSLGFEELRQQLAEIRWQLELGARAAGGSDHGLETLPERLPFTAGSSLEKALVEDPRHPQSLPSILHAPSAAASKVAQLVLLNQYRELAARGGPPLPFQDVEFRAFSQNGEDGLLLYVFGLIGMGQRKCLEICAGDGVECNTANLIINHGWNGLLFEGNETLVARGRSFYARLGDSFCLPPKFVHAWVAREDINEKVRANGFEGPIDLLSLDVDGVDYWIWEALEVVRPRVVIAEIQCVWGADRAVTVPYAPDFRTRFIDGFAVYSGASLPAFVKLARRKGYRLVGVQRLGFNAIFVENGVGEDLLPEVDVESCVQLPFVQWARRDLLAKVKDLEWVEV